MEQERLKHIVFVNSSIGDTSDMVPKEICKIICQFIGGILPIDTSVYFTNKIKGDGKKLKADIWIRYNRHTNEVIEEHKVSLETSEIETYYIAGYHLAPLSRYTGDAEIFAYYSTVFGSTKFNLTSNVSYIKIKEYIYHNIEVLEGFLVKYNPGNVAEYIKSPGNITYVEQPVFTRRGKSDGKITVFGEFISKYLYYAMQLLTEVKKDYYNTLAAGERGNVFAPIWQLTNLYSAYGILKPFGQIEDEWNKDKPTKNDLACILIQTLDELLPHDYYSSDLCAWVKYNRAYDCMAQYVLLTYLKDILGFKHKDTESEIVDLRIFNDPDHIKMLLKLPQNNLAKAFYTDAVITDNGIIYANYKKVSKDMREFFEEYAKDTEGELKYLVYNHKAYEASVIAAE